MHSCIRLLGGRMGRMVVCVSAGGLQGLIRKNSPPPPTNVHAVLNLWWVYLHCPAAHPEGWAERNKILPEDCSHSFRILCHKFASALHKHTSPKNFNSIITPVPLMLSLPTATDYVNFKFKSIKFCLRANHKINIKCRLEFPIKINDASDNHESLGRGVWKYRGM